jgi:HEAT repeat protein/thiol-disulfide isomerase/thioredoxin
VIIIKTQVGVEGGDKMGLVDKWFGGKKKSEEPVQDRKVSRVPPSRYTDAELNQQVKNGWAMVYFWTPLSVPSIKQEPAIDALAAKLSGKVKLLKVNADENTSFAKRFAISAIPTTILLKDGRVIDCFIPIPKESDLLKQIGSIGTLEVLSEETPTKMSDIIAQVREKSGRVELHVEELKRKKDVDGLIGALKYREDGDIRADAAFALGDMKSDERVIKPLIEALGDNYFAVVAGAAKSLGQIHDAAAVEPLIRVLLNSGALTARSNAAVALGEINDTRAVESLIRALREDKTPEVRERAAWALRQVKDERAIQPLIQAMRDDENWDVRGEATGALSDMGEAAVPFLIEALENDNDGIRGGAILALGHIGDKRAIVPLRQVLKYSKASIRDEASRVIKMIE